MDELNTLQAENETLKRDLDQLRNRYRLVTAENAALKTVLNEERESYRRLEALYDGLYRAIAKCKEEKLSQLEEW